MMSPCGYLLNNTIYRIEHDCDGTRYYVTTLPLGAVLGVKLGLNVLITNYTAPHDVSELYVDMLLETPLGMKHPTANLHNLNGSIAILVDVRMETGYEAYDYLHILPPTHVIEIVSEHGFFHLQG